MSSCDNTIDGTDLKCGDQVGDLRRYCSTGCAEEGGRAELEELGITLDMLRSALDGYYECKTLINRHQDPVDAEASVSDSYGSFVQE